MEAADKARERLRARVLERPCLIDCHAHVGVSYQSYLDYGYPYCMSFEDASIRMGVLGVDFSMFTRFGSSAYYRLWPGTPETVEPSGEFCRFPYEIENRSMLQEIYQVFPEHSGRALPFLQFDPLRKTAEQAEHLEDLCSEYPDTIIWGSDTPGNYYIRKHRDAKGELVDCDLRSSFDAETRILRALADVEVRRISYGNTVRFLFG